MTRWWRRLEARERRLIAAAGCVLVAALGYLLLWEPAADGIRRLQVDLPRLQEQNAALRAMSTEVAALRATAGSTAPIVVADREAAVQRSLDRAGLRQTTEAQPPTQPTRAPVADGGVTVGPASATRTPRPEVATDGDRVRVRFEEIDYGVWAGWLAGAETELGARAVRVSIASSVPKGPVGHVRAEALLDWTRP